MSTLAEQALSDARARAHEVDYLEGTKGVYPSILGRCLKAQMPIQKARDIVEACKGKRQPHVFCTKCISRWRAER